ncbi:MAG: anti-sigma factor domain-containing protein [Vallitalea sp.]|jgi:hypothetical protein|nr:anti-sigma factor domain-containing protein [Vallitalea sp.]
MRGVVIEKNPNYIIVITKDGQFKKISGSSYNVDVGMEININNSISKNMRRIAAIIVLVILISGFGVSTYAYYTPYGYINVDSNPSIEIIYNRFNRILEVNGINEDGKSIVNSLIDYKYKKVDLIMNEVINETTQKEDEEINVLITYNKLGEDTLNNIKNNSEDNVKIYSIEVTTDEYKNAKNNDLSLGKTTLINKIKENDVTYEDKQLEEKTINELIEIVEDSTHENKSDKDKNNKKLKDKNNKEPKNRGKKLEEDNEENEDEVEQKENQKVKRKGSINKKNGKNEDEAKQDYVKEKGDYDEEDKEDEDDDIEDGDYNDEKYDKDDKEEHEHEDDKEDDYKDKREYKDVKKQKKYYKEDKKLNKEDEDDKNKQDVRKREIERDRKVKENDFINIIRQLKNHNNKKEEIFNNKKNKKIK